MNRPPNRQALMYYVVKTGMLVFISLYINYIKMRHVSPLWSDCILFYVSKFPVSIVLLANKTSKFKEVRKYKPIMMYHELGDVQVLNNSSDSQH